MNKVASSPQHTEPEIKQLSLFALLEQLQSEPKPEPKQAKSFELRDYQKQVIRETYHFFRNEIKSVLVYAPTGAGKTVISSQMIVDAVLKGRRVMFCCHRKKLIDQTQQTLAAMGIESGIIWADHPTDYSKPVQICMIQTIQNRELPPDIGLVIFDECHSSIYYQIAWDLMTHYSGGIFALSKCYFIGLTATPWRTKYKEGFCQFFQALVRAPDPIELVNMGYLSRPRLFGYGGLLDFEKLETNNLGDYTQSSMQAVCNEEYNTEVVKYFLQICPERKTIAFCASVFQAYNLAEQFNEVGIKSEVVVGTTSDSEREAIYQRFKSGETQLISSVACLCEGFDEPSVQAAIIARPTRSQALLIQMCGRALRLHPSKQDAMLLDFGECFKRVCKPTSKLKISLCPRPKPLIETQLKECFNCHEMIPVFCKICPECGYEFSGDGDDDDEPDSGEPPIFGELLDEQELRQLRYIRSQMKRAYKAGRNPARIKMLFREKFGYFAPDDWFVGAIFGGKNSTANKAIYLDFLYQLRPNAPKPWIRYMMELEFGKPGRKYQNSKGKTYTATRNNLERKHWWMVLEIEPGSSFKEIKQAYRKLAKQWHPDICGDAKAKDMMTLINHAFEKAKRFCGQD